MRTRLLGVLVFALLLAGCGGSAAMAPTSAPAEAVQSMPAAPAATAAPARDAAGGAAVESYAAPKAPAGQATGNSTLPDVGRLVIKNAELTVEVKDITAAQNQLQVNIGQLGGYIVSASVSGTDERQTSVVSFRVPSARFNDALTGLQGLAEKILSRNVGGSDVTEEYVDLESRVRNLEATQVRLLDLLNRADKVEDMLNINNVLTDVQGQIEQAKGRMQYLKQNSAMSTITVTFQPVPLPVVESVVPEEGWQPMNIARATVRDLLSFGQGLLSLAIVALIWSPVWVTIVLLLRWAWLRMLGGRRAPVKEPQQPASID